MRALPVDLSYALRLWTANPCVSAVAAISLALAIGEVSAVFGVLDALLWRPLPIRDPHQLVRLSMIKSDGSERGLALPSVELLRARQQSFSSMLGWVDTVAVIESGSTVTRGRLLAVTGNFFAELGVGAVVGRLLEPQDSNLETLRPEPIAVLGQRTWELEFGADPSIVGRVLLVNDIPLTIIGVAPKGFTGLSLLHEPAMTIPIPALTLVARRDPSELRDPLLLWMNVVGRLRPGVTPSAARVEFEALWPVVQAAMGPSVIASRQSELRSLQMRASSGAAGYEPHLRDRMTTPLKVLMVVSALMLLIACVNVAGLMIARAAARVEQWRTRQALGARHWHLLRLAVVEGTVAAFVGTGLGLLLAMWASKTLVNLILQAYSPSASIAVGLDFRMLAFTCIVAVVTTIGLSTAPLWTVLHFTSRHSMLEAVRVVGGIPKTGRIVIVAQVALSLVLLAEAGLLVRSVQRLASVDLGYRSSDVLVADLSPRSKGYETIEPSWYYANLLDRVRAVPGVNVASLSHFSPASGNDQTEVIASALAPPGVDEIEANIALVSTDFFRTIDLPVLQGRAISSQDHENSGRVALISRALASHLFKGGSALGQHIRIGEQSEQQQVEVVGIVEDARLYNPRDGNTPVVYLPHLQAGNAGFYNVLLIKKTGGAPTNAIIAAVASLGVEDVTWVRSLSEIEASLTYEDRIVSLVTLCFGSVSLFLAAIGIYSVMSLSMSFRRREIAVRAALGARRHSLLRSALAEMIVLLTIGIGIGLPIAILAARFAASLLFGLGPADPATMIVSVSLLFTVGLIAAFVPARAACDAVPSQALRV